jgi:dTMP kinase
MNRRGIFITFEGPDGAGKTTQIRLLADQLMESGIECLVTREPGGTPISDRIRELLLDPAYQEMSPTTEVLLYAASRAQHVAEKIRPALERGCLVLCDRYIDASIAYQSAGLGVSPDFVKKVSEEATEGLWPDRTYLLDVPVKIGMERISNRIQAQPDRIESRSVEYHERVRTAFHRIAEEEPNRVCVISGAQSMEQISADIWKDWVQINRKWGERG